MIWCASVTKSRNCILKTMSQKCKNPTLFVFNSCWRHVPWQTMWKTTLIWGKDVMKQYSKGYMSDFTQGLPMFPQCLWWPFLVFAVLLPTVNSRKPTKILKSILRMQESGCEMPRCQYSWTLEELRSGCPQRDIIPFLNELQPGSERPWNLLSCGCMFHWGIIMSLWCSRRYFWIWMYLEYSFDCTYKQTNPHGVAVEWWNWTSSFSSCWGLFLFSLYGGIQLKLWPELSAAIPLFPLNRTGSLIGKKLQNSKTAIKKQQC